METPAFYSAYPAFGGDEAAARRAVLGAAYRQGQTESRGLRTPDEVRRLVLDAIAAGLVTPEECSAAWRRGAELPAGMAESRPRLIDDLRSLRYDTLYPFRDWLVEQPWRSPWVQLVLFLALAPMAIATVFGSSRNLADVVWALGLYFAVLWGAIVYWIVRPPRLHLPTLALAAVVTVALGVPLVLVVQELPFVSLLYAGASSTNPIGQFLGFLLAVGPIEETAKALPVLWLVFRTRNLQGPREAAFAGAICGLAFGVSEAVNYSFAYAAANRYAGLPYGDYLLLQTIRLISLPFLHAIWAAIAGYYLGLAALVPARSRAMVLVGLALAAGLHGLYDFLSPGWSSLVIYAASLLAFVGYARRAEAIAGDLQMPPAQPAEAVTPGSAG